MEIFFKLKSNIKLKTEQFLTQNTCIYMHLRNHPRQRKSNSETQASKYDALPRYSQITKHGNLFSRNVISFVTSHCCVWN